MKLSKSHKDKIIGGIIGIIFLLLTLIIKECFQKHSSKSDSQQTNTYNSIKSEDSSSLVIIQSQQNNSGSGRMSVENIGTKNVTLKETKQMAKLNNLSKRDKINIEENSGNINIGENKGIIGDNNTININPPVFQRHLTLEGIENLRHILPKKKVDFYMSAYNFDPESVSFANEIVDYMKSKGFNWAVDVIGQTMGSPPVGKSGEVEVNISPDSSVYFTVYPIK